MGITLHDSEGNEVVLPIDKVEDVAALQETVKRLEGEVSPDWRNARQKMSEQDGKIAKIAEMAKAAGFELQPDGTLKKIELAPGGGAPAAGVDEKKVKEISEAAARDVVASAKAEELKTELTERIAALTKGDTNKVAVIQEKYDSLRGAKVVTTKAEMNKILEEAMILVNYGRGMGTNSVENMGTGAGGGSGPERGGSQSKERGKEFAKGFGYKFKSDPNKL